METISIEIPNELIPKALDTLLTWVAIADYGRSIFNDGQLEEAKQDVIHQLLDCITRTDI